MAPSGISKEARLIWNLRMHIENGGNLNSPDLLEESIISRAVDQKMYDLAEWLIYNGADILNLNAEEEPALYTVMSKGTKPVIKAAIDYCEVHTDIHHSILEAAFGHLCINAAKNPETIPLDLIILAKDRLNIDVDRVTNNNLPILFRLVEECNYTIIELLTDNGAKFVPSVKGESFHDFVTSQMYNLLHRKHDETPYAEKMKRLDYYKRLLQLSTH